LKGGVSDRTLQDRKIERSKVAAKEISPGKLRSPARISSIHHSNPFLDKLLRKNPERVSAQGEKRKIGELISDYFKFNEDFKACQGAFSSQRKSLGGESNRPTYTKKNLALIKSTLYNRINNKFL
jgi:hypothetical protein